MKHWLPKELIAKRVEVADRIIARLTKTINTLRANNVSSVGKQRNRHASPETPGDSAVREVGTSYQTGAEVAPDLITDEDIDELLQID